MLQQGGGVDVDQLLEGALLLWRLALWENERKGGLMFSSRCRSEDHKRYDMGRQWCPFRGT